jgi:hypothetical protein
MSSTTTWNAPALLAAAERGARSIAQRDGEQTYQRHLIAALSRTVRQLCEEHGKETPWPEDGIVVRVKGRTEVLLRPERDLGFEVYAASPTEPIDSLIKTEVLGELIRAWEQHQAAENEAVQLHLAGVL